MALLASSWPSFCMLIAVWSSALSAELVHDLPALRSLWLSAAYPEAAQQAVGAHKEQLDALGPADGLQLHRMLLYHLQHKTQLWSLVRSSKGLPEWLCALMLLVHDGAEVRGLLDKGALITVMVLSAMRSRMLAGVAYTAALYTCMPLHCNPGRQTDMLDGSLIAVSDLELAKSRP